MDNQPTIYSLAELARTTTSSTNDAEDPQTKSMESALNNLLQVWFFSFENTRLL
jgi:hypothetical protein